MNTKFLLGTVLGWIWLFTGAAIPSSYGQSESSQGATGNEICWWAFDKENQHFVFDKSQQKKDSLNGNFEYVPGIYGNALKLDGFRTYISRDSYSTVNLKGGFTLESWIALASYPWSWSPVLDCSHDNLRGFFLGIDREGRIGFKVPAGSSYYEVQSKETIPLREWTHIAAVFEPDKQITVFINGEEKASVDIEGKYISTRWGSLTIGRTRSAQTWNEFQLTTPNTHFFLDGVVDEVKISGKAKTEDEISSNFHAVTDLPAPALSDRGQFPTGPAGSGSFGAFYTKLDYYEEWDDMWRVSDKSDVFVRFDDSPAQLVFWRGTSFVPCWVSENDIWYTNEWLETWGSDVVSCAEPIMDRDCRYSHVRIIENTDARVVVHWRYALNDAFYDFAAISDDGRGEWCDEYHIIYPDMVGVRKMELHYSKPERKHDWVEQIVVLPPGKYPDDVIKKDAISLVNMSGDVEHYSWYDEDLKVEMPEPENANMSLVQLKSEYRPFFILPPDPVETVEGSWDSPFFRTYASKMAGGGYSPDPAPTVYGWWNHWPVAQVPGDGRWVTRPDRPSHFNLTTFVQWNDYEITEKTRTRIMLQGMTDKKAGELVPVAKSWLQSPKMSITSDAYKGGSYDRSERAYIIENRNPGNQAPCSFVLEASDDSPLLNPAFIIEKWGGDQATLTINGQKVDEGEKFRQGTREGPYGKDLIVWIELESQNPVNISLE